MPTAEGKTFTFEPESNIRSNFLETFAFNSPQQFICIETAELNAVCPFSGLPDYGTLQIEYFPTGGLCIELKAFKYYLISFRNVGIYQEALTQRVYQDLKQTLKTEKLRVQTVYNLRGGFKTTCTEGQLGQAQKAQPTP